MLKIGITGGIGSGKSFVCEIVRNKGYPVFNCDVEAKRLMVKDKATINAISTIVGPNAYSIDIDDDGKEKRTLNRKVVADFLFANKTNAQVINDIVHPRLAKVFEQWARHYEETAEMVFLEAAILFESGFDKLVDSVILVCADYETRIQRVMKRDNTTREMVLKRIERQVAQEELMKKNGNNKMKKRRQYNYGIF